MYTLGYTLYTMILQSENKLCKRSIHFIKAGHIWNEIQLLQQGLAELQSMYGQGGCTEADLLINLRTTMLLDFSHSINADLQN